jgi:hypothetical protein
MRAAGSFRERVLDAAQLVVTEESRRGLPVG